MIKCENIFVKQKLKRGKMGIFLILFLLITAHNSPAVSLKGTFTTLGQGYQEEDGKDHFILAPRLNFKVNDTVTKGLSFQSYFQYYGDTYSSYGSSGAWRLYHGFLNYDRRDFPFKLRFGRFFLFRGVGVGVLDGGELTYKAHRNLSLTVFVGQQGPWNREFELTKDQKSTMYGGEVSWFSRKIPGKPSVVLSYTHQEREGNLIRHLLGLCLGFRLSREWSSLNVLHLNLSGSALRRALTRWRYVGNKVQFSAEVALITPYTAAYSYFSDFIEEGAIVRLKNTTEYYVIPRKWGVGLSTMYFATSEYGFRIGPYMIFPYGRIGYQSSSGNQPQNDVLWGQARFSPIDEIDLFAYVAQMEYDWEAMDIDPQETTMLNLGCTVRPPLLKRTEWDVEWQNYRTPEVNLYRRLILVFRWNFDYPGGK
jgi:hypothetical protein